DFFGDDFNQVGVSGPAATPREYASQTYFPAVPDNVVRSSCTRDGFLSGDGVVTANGGDSGGPHLTERNYTFNGQAVEGQRHLLAVQSNGCPSAAPAN